MRLVVLIFWPGSEYVLDAPHRHLKLRDTSEVSFAILCGQ